MYKIKLYYLPVQLGSFNITKAIGFWSGQQEEIGGDKLVILHTDDVANLNFVPTLLNRLAIAQHVRFAVVDLWIASMSLLLGRGKRFEVIVI